MRSPLRLRLPPARGSILIFAVILVGVLAAIGGAAVLLSSRDRINAGAKTRRDVVSACASAAQAKLWAELAKYGPNLFGSTTPVAELTLADGTRLGTLHYDQTAGIPMSDVAVLLANDFGDGEITDLTNKASGLLANARVFRVVARCTVPGSGFFARDRQVEVEFRLRTRM
jgi:hypothetical protein